MLYVYFTTNRVMKQGYFKMKYYRMTKQLYLGLWASNKKKSPIYFLNIFNLKKLSGPIFITEGPQTELWTFFIFYQKLKTL